MLPATTPAALLTSSVRMSEVLGSQWRLDAAAFGIAAKEAVAALSDSGFEILPLYGAGGVCTEATGAFRLKRIFVDQSHGVPFLSSSDIISMRPDVHRYVSRKLTKGLDDMLVKQWDVLVSRSGTVGNVGLAGRTYSGCALSEHAIRLRTEAPETAGFVAAFLRSRFGRPQLQGASYGSVVVHIEVEHLEHVRVAGIPRLQMAEIGSLMCRAADRRDEANEALDKAEALLLERLGLPPLPDKRTKLSIDVSAKSFLQTLRFDASFYNGRAEAALRSLHHTALEVLSLGDSRLTAEIRPVTRFRKRTYVRFGGIPLYGGKQLFQVDPVDVKHLAKGAHEKDLGEIALAPNMVLVTCSGTIGRVQIVPEYMAGWAANQHSIRVIAAADVEPGFLYAWLASSYGKCLITRHSYGSVILEIDREMLAGVPVPLADASTRTEVGELVSLANAKRTTAWEYERAAIEQLEELVGRGSAMNGKLEPL